MKVEGLRERAAWRAGLSCRRRSVRCQYRTTGLEGFMAGLLALALTLLVDSCVMEQWSLEINLWSEVRDA